MTTTKVPSATWSRFLTWNMEIEVDLVEQSHEFPFGDYIVKISLPGSKFIPTEPNQGDRLTFSTHRVVNDQKIPSFYYVHSVDITVQGKENILIPEIILDCHPNAYDIVSKEKQEYFTKIISAHEIIAQRAFDYWARALRWQCDNSRLCRPPIQDHESGWSTHLFDPNSDHKFWAKMQIYVVPGYKPISTSQWLNTQTILFANQEVPISIDLLFDGIEHQRYGDLRRATVDFAVASEAFLRELIASNLPSNLSTSLKAFIDEANIRAVLTKFIPEILTEPERKALKAIEKTLHKLFDARNKIVHIGRKDVSTSECAQFLEATRKLLYLRYKEITNY